MDPEERQTIADEASAAMGPLAQVVSAYYHSLVDRAVPPKLARRLTIDFQWYYLSEDAERTE